MTTDGYVVDIKMVCVYEAFERETSPMGCCECLKHFPSQWSCTRTALMVKHDDREGTGSKTREKVYFFPFFLET